MEDLALEMFIQVKRKLCEEKTVLLWTELTKAAPELVVVFCVDEHRDCSVTVIGGRTIDVWMPTEKCSYDLYSHDGDLLSVPFFLADKDKLLAYVKKLAEEAT